MKDSENKKSEQQHKRKRSDKDRRKLDIYRYLDQDEVDTLRPNRRRTHRREKLPYVPKKKGSIQIEHISHEATICPFDRTKHEH